MYQLLLYLAVGSAVIRSAWLLVGLVRVIPVHMRARTRRWGLAEVLAFLELPVLLALTCTLVLRPLPSPTGSPTGSTASVFAAAVGAMLALAGLFVSLWAISTTVRRRVILDAGHFVKEEHPLLTRGAYGFVRNPMYLGVILTWFGLATAFQNVPLLLFSAGYVTPVYWFYIRAEERMMSSEFGVQFEEYTRCVGRLFPRWRRGAA
jgi:protein-S-isoprenylcysteine O-methyltransferase Ste14